MNNIAKTLWILSIEVPENIHIDKQIRPIMYFDTEEVCNKYAMKLLNMGFKILKAHDIINSE